MHVSTIECEHGTRVQREKCLYATIRCAGMHNKSGDVRIHIGRAQCIDPLASPR